MIAFFADFLTLVWALRWILVFVAFVTLGGLLAEAWSTSRQRAERITELEQDNAALRRGLIVANAARQARRRRPIIAGRVVS